MIIEIGLLLDYSGYVILKAHEHKYILNLEDISNPALSPTHDVHDEEEMATSLDYSGNEMPSSYLQIASPVPFPPQNQAFSIISVNVMLIS